MKRYNKIVKVKNEFLQVASPLTVVYAGLIQKGQVSSQRELLNAFSPSSFRLVADPQQATVFTLSQAEIIRDSYELTPPYYQVRIISIEPTAQTAARQLNMTNSVGNDQRTNTATTVDFDSLKKFDEIKSSLASPQVAAVAVDFSKFKVRGLTIRKEHKKLVLANAIDEENNQVLVLTSQREIPFVVNVVEIETGANASLGSLT